MTRHASQPILRVRCSFYAFACRSIWKLSLRSITKIMFAHTSPSYRDLSTEPPRRAAPRFSPCFSLLCSVKWPTNLYNLPSVEGKMTWARTCAATCPNSFNPLIVRIIFLILRQTTTISRMYRAARIEFFILLVNT